MRGACWVVVAGTALLGSPATLRADERAEDAAKLEKDFESSIRPLLIERCQKCHGSVKQQGGLRVDSREALLAGGDSGPAIVPGAPEQSLLVSAVRHGEIVQMPPDGRLSPPEVAALEVWIASGAVWPHTLDDTTSVEPSAGQQPVLEARSASDPHEPGDHWAFQSVVDHAPPEVRNAAWCKSDLDRFILAALEGRGIAPAPAAARWQLIRRATFDLWGLPPTPAEVMEFVADESPDAFARLVERLLASPRYGQRWGRHWLDVARYADSNGLDENLAYGNAWRYRDWVVDALNRDLPYDEFLRQQLAGDLLPDPGDEKARQAQLIATGFLCLGAKMLAEDDPVKMEMDIVDEQVDTIGQALLGLTIGCARCHDHKYDPLSMEDYYALAGIFKSTQTMDTFTVVARWHERPLVPAAMEKQVVEQAKMPPVEGQPPAAPVAWAMAVEDRAVENLRVHIRGSHLNLGAEVPRRFPLVLAGSDQRPLPRQQSGRLELAHWIARRENPLTARVMVNRLWRWHFGRGLVASCDNFGKLGERPTNLQLLDWLAARLPEGGWSLKQMHRLMMNSATYQMSSARSDAAAVDPENRLWWRVERRRVEVEALRDALLAVGGELDLGAGGSLLKTNNREYVTGTASVNPTTYDAPRRSLYLPVVRSALFDLFQVFDFAEPSVLQGDRPTTTVAPQALFLLNGQLVHRQAARLADRLLAAWPDDDSRINQAMLTTLGRPPKESEMARAKSFLHDYRALLGEPLDMGTREAWCALCRTLLASNEFSYID